MSEKFQFIRIKTYSAHPSKLATGENGKAWSSDDVDGEASRNELNCAHVFRPTPPQPIGLSIQAFSAQRALMLRDQDAAAQTAGRPRPRRDRHTLMSIVASNPEDPIEIERNPAAKKRFRSWVAKTIRFVRRKFKSLGIQFRAFVVHTDERFHHLHCLGYAPELPMGNVRLGHPGWIARYEALAAGASPKAASRAARAAYRAFGDAYHAEVSVEFGHLRVGRYLKRLPRAEALKAAEADRTAAKALEAGWANIRARTAAIEARERETAEMVRRQLKQIEAEVAKARADAERTIAAAQRTRAEVVAYIRKHQTAANAQVAKLTELCEVAQDALAQCIELKSSLKSQAMDEAAWIKMLCNKVMTELDPDTSARVAEIAAEIVSLGIAGLTDAEKAISFDQIEEVISELLAEAQSIKRTVGTHGAA